EMESFVRIIVRGAPLLPPAILAADCRLEFPKDKASDPGSAFRRAYQPRGRAGLPLRGGRARLRSVRWDSAAAESELRTRRGVDRQSEACPTVRILPSDQIPRARTGERSLRYQ